MVVVELSPVMLLLFQCLILCLPLTKTITKLELIQVIKEYKSTNTICFIGLVYTRSSEFSATL